MYGLSDNEIAAVYSGSLEEFTAREAALLRMADAMSDTPSNVSDDPMPSCAGVFPKNN